MGFSRQKYWSGLPIPSPGDCPNQGSKPGSPALQADSLLSKPWTHKPVILSPNHREACCPDCTLVTTGKTTSAETVQVLLCSVFIEWFSIVFIIGAHWWHFLYRLSCCHGSSQISRSLGPQTSEMLTNTLPTIHSQGTRVDGYIAPWYMPQMHLSWALILLPKMSCVVEFFLPIAVTQHFSLTETFPSSLAHLYFPSLTSISGKFQLHSNPCL